MIRWFAIALPVSLCSVISAQDALLPEKNGIILEYVNDVMGKKVGRGECWDLAKEALDEAQAKWTPPYEFGMQIDHLAEPVLPGDVVQFKNVKLKYRQDNMTIEESMTHHTAIIYKVNQQGNYVLAHQNFGKGRRRVGTSGLNVEHMTQGTISVYRPQ